SHRQGVIARSYLGLIDEASIYSRALTAAQMQTIYDAGGSGKCLSGHPPRIVSITPTNQTVVLGYNATITVLAVGTPPLTYQWFRNSVLLPGQTDPTITLNAVQSGAAGFYLCRVTNVH